ncbi:MAG: hypothetical protein E7378_03335 [Clostridiales bacterium]|nr:hypothetical protein [Clostridiales bacterium]
MEKQEIIQDLIGIKAGKKTNAICSKLKRYNSGKIKHLKQLAFHMCNKKNRWVFGGNRSGKTECGAVETVWLARGIHPYRQNRKDAQIWVVSLSTQVQRDVAQSKVLGYLNKNWIKDIVMISGRKDALENGVIDYITIHNVFGGVSKIGFKSCDQGREKFQGTSLDYVWFDEEPPEDIYKECKMRVLDKCGEVYGTMTPLKGLTWVYNTIYLNENNDDEIWCEFMEWADNPYLSQAEVKSLTATLSQEELESRRYGKFNSFGGQVYSEFDESVNVIEPFNVPIDWYDNISIDPGLNNPLSAHWYAVDYDGNIYVIAEHYETRQTVEHHAGKIKAICDRLGWHKASNGMYSAIIDSAANQRTLSSPKNVVELFYDYGILVNPKVNKDLYSGVNRVKSYLKSADGTSRLYIFKNCTNMIREIKGYFWGNSDAPIKKDDHAMDDLRYYIMSRPENQAPKQQKTAIQKDKERLMRKLKKYY